MAADGVIVKIEGIGELKRALAELPAKLRRKALLDPMKKAMRVVRDFAKQAVPVLSAPSPYRTKGTLKRRLSVRVSRVSRQAGDVGVFVNIKPLKAAQIRAAKGKGLKVAPNDPFYWRFVEFGTRKLTARPFLTPAAGKLQEAMAIFEREVRPEIEKLNKRGA